MTQRGRASKFVVYSLIVALANPALMTPWVHARDSDIFVGQTSIAGTAEPNILLVLDTSDSMNNYEGWREYPGAYDSHVEYLWNDTAYIDTITTTAPNPELTNIGSSPDRYFVDYTGTCPDAGNPTCPRDSGYFAGSSDAQRQAMKAAALAHAGATEAGDPGARSTYRNYSDASWIYWLPSGTAESDARMWSFAFNRFGGGIRVSSFSNTNSTLASVVRASINYGPALDHTPSTAVRTTTGAYNQCTASLDKLLPSTVYAPTEFARNDGKWLNQKWNRYERWLNLARPANTAYPGDHAQQLVGGLFFRLGALGRQYDRIATPFPGPFDPRVDGPSATPPGVNAPPAPGITAGRDITGAANRGHEGQPIRVQDSSFNGDPTDSYAGWTEPKADLGGYVFQSYVNTLAEARLVETRNLYGYSLLAVPNANSTERERFSGWLGNRDATGVAFGSVTGTPAYFNIRDADLTASAGGTVLSCSRVCGQLQVGTSGPIGDGPDARNIQRRYYTPGNGGLYCDPNGTLTGAGCGLVPDPPLCGPQGIESYFNTNPTNCQWSGRSSRVIEGVGTVYYGGTCSGQCRGAGFILGGADCAAGTNSTSYCNAASAGSEGANWIGSYTIDGTTYSNVTKNVEGTCAPVADTSQSCTQRKGTDCLYGPANPAALCSTTLTSSQVTGATTVGYPRYARGGVETYLVHDCKADEPSANGGTNVFMTSVRRNFNRAYNGNVSTLNANASYTSNANDATNPPAIDLYSVNYLNWKYGPKGPNGHPIGRKTRLQIAKDALATLVSQTNSVRFGLMTFNALPADGGLQSTQGSQGGKVVYPVRRMGASATDTDYPNRSDLIRVINSQVAKAATPLTESLYEAYLYFSGRAPRYGTAAAITANFGAAALPAIGGGVVTDGADASAVSNGLYVSPMLANPNTSAPNACQKNFVITITDGGPERDVDTNSLVPQLSYDSNFRGIVAPDTRIDVSQTDTATGQFETASAAPYGPPSKGDESRPDGGYVWLDELAFFMSRGDMSPGARHLSTDTGTDSLPGTQPIISYTIGFAGADSPLLQNTAERATGTYYIAEDSAQLSQALADALVQIQQWNPTIAAPTVPVSALNRTQNAADVYLSFFEPTVNQSWKGTVKRFRIGSGTTDCGPSKEICLIGKTVLASGTRDVEKVELDPLTGFSQTIIDPDSVSFWNPITERDGSEPDKGGTGFQTINTTGVTPASRKVYTWIASGSTTGVLTDATNDFSEANTRVSKTLLGNAGMTDSFRSTVINYLRGGNVGSTACSDADAGTACTTWRAWAHSDVQHSRPVVVTYDGTPVADPEVSGSQRATTQYLYYLTNDGLLHAVDAANGREQWAFMVEEALPRLKDVLANSNGASLDLADGAPVVWIDSGNSDGIVNGSERVWLFFGLRRGGRSYYALDITNPAQPAFMWRISSDYHPTTNPGGTGTLCTAASGCSAAAGYNLLGQTWSTPVVGRVAATTGASGARPNGNADPVVLFGGGYDPQQDTEPLPTGTTQDPIGRALFVVEGSTGTLVRSFSNTASDFLNATAIDWSIPSDLAALNTDLDANALLDRVLVGDMGGNLWRFDIANVDASQWRGKKLAALSDTGVPNRKIMFPPSVVPQLAPYPVEWQAVYVGTGDREHPLVTTSTDKVFMVADFDVGTTATSGTAASFAAGDFLQLTATTTTGVVPNQLVTKRGWYRDLETGEKVTGATFVINQRLRFSTYSPTAISNDCLPAGQGRLNEVSALYGDLVDLNGDGTISARDRYYAGVSRGFFSPVQTVVIGNTIYSIALGVNVTQTTSAATPASGAAACQTGSQFWYCREQRIGVAQRIYWYMEPEQ